MIFAFCNEIKLRRPEIEDYEVIKTIYFGGGTPSVLAVDALQFVIDTIYENYIVADDVEITIEANPDDLSSKTIKKLAKSKINRLSIGIQSFFDEDLHMMNRAHNAREALDTLQEAQHYFDNISIDLIYGIPGMSAERWKENISIALAANVPHISCYALTVEPKTALEKLIEKGAIPAVDDALAQQHFEILVDALEKEGFIHYELSNFGKPDYFSKNNTAYWQGKNYLGIGPAAHSYINKKRSWNINNNSKYLKALQDNQLPSTAETLTTTDQYNEYIMTGLRTIWGVSLSYITTHFGDSYRLHALEQAQRHIDEHLLFIDNNTLFVSQKGKFLCDGIASDLFLLNLD